MLPPSKSFLFPTSPKLRKSRRGSISVMYVIKKKENLSRALKDVNKGLNWIVDDCRISLAAGSIQVDVSESNPDKSLVGIGCGNIPGALIPFHL